MNNAIKQNVRMGMILTPRLDQESISTVLLLAIFARKSPLQTAKYFTIYFSETLLIVSCISEVDWEYCSFAA